jgi:hypothetical protein
MLLDRRVLRPKLPLGERSLKFGSNDGGKTFHHELPDLNSVVDEISKAMNLAPHTVKDNVIRPPGVL